MFTANAQAFNLTTISQTTFPNYEIALAVKLRRNTYLDLFHLFLRHFQRYVTFHLVTMYNAVCRDVLSTATAARAYSE